MFKKLKSLLLIIPLACVCMLCACSNSNNASEEINVTDLCGRNITLDKPATKIAALSASDCEVLYAIGAGDSIIARGTFCDYPEQVKNVKDLGSGELTNIEELVAAKPDIVLMSKTGFTLDQVNAMEAAGLKTCVNEPNSFDDTYVYIKLLGDITGHERQASDLVASMSKKVNELSQKAKEKSNAEQKTVYFQLCMPMHGYWTAGKNTFMDEMAQMLYLKNAFNDVDGWAEVSAEQIEARNPDLTIVVDDDTSFTRPGPRLIDAMSSLYNKAYEG